MRVHAFERGVHIWNVLRKMVQEILQKQKKWGFAGDISTVGSVQTSSPHYELEIGMSAMNIRTSVGCRFQTSSRTTSSGKLVEKNKAKIVSTD